jgi:hypothetical protein
VSLSLFLFEHHDIRGLVHGGAVTLACPPQLAAFVQMSAAVTTMTAADLPYRVLWKNKGDQAALLPDHEIVQLVLSSDQ